jgi:hypothetical protein
MENQLLELEKEENQSLENKKIKCNKCGKNICDSNNEYVRISNFWGYFSEIFKDGENHTINLCEKCMADIISTFKIAPIGFGRSIFEYDEDDKSEQEIFEKWKSCYIDW